MQLTFLQAFVLKSNDWLPLTKPLEVTDELLKQAGFFGWWIIDENGNVTHQCNAEDFKNSTEQFQVNGIPAISSGIIDKIEPNLDRIDLVAILQKHKYSDLLDWELNYNVGSSKIGSPALWHKKANLEIHYEQAQWYVSNIFGTGYYPADTFEDAFRLAEFLKR